MTPSPHSTVPPGRVSATSRADQLAGVEAPTPPPAPFIPVRSVDSFGNGVQSAADRHERLVASSLSAPVGYKRTTERLLYIAAHERLAAELGAGL